MKKIQQNSHGMVNLDQKRPKSQTIFGVSVFITVLFVSLFYAGSHFLQDVAEAPSHLPMWPYVLLIIALLIALGFEFVNGFHDTSNAVATVIYTHSLNPYIAVAWSGIWNFIGVITSNGVVAFTIVSLLPVELILQAGSGAGLAMVFSLLISASIWNLGTWWLGLPSSSSHTLIGSIIGVGLMNQMMSVHTQTSGVNWRDVYRVIEALLFSPIIGFVCAGLLLLVCRRFIKQPELYAIPHNNRPPPFWIRSLLLLTCTGVSFAHGSNDGQKGLGLIMLILIGTMPTTYALNHAVISSQAQDFLAVSDTAASTLTKYITQPIATTDEHATVLQMLTTQQVSEAGIAAEQKLILEVRNKVFNYNVSKPALSTDQSNIRNDIYLTNEALSLMIKRKSPAFSATDLQTMENYHRHLQKSIEYIPPWVKVIVAAVLGLGTMVGWKRIVKTVGEGIGKAPMTYAQGACAELTAMTTILAGDKFGLPISTTHVLSSGVAGTMAADHAGIQWNTVRNILIAWIFTLPISALLSGVIFWSFLKGSAA